jgi:hypothetical protein
MADHVALMYSQQRSKMTTSMSDEDLQNKLNSELGAGGNDILRVTVSSKKGGFLAFNSSIENVTVGVVVDSSKADKLRSTIDPILSSLGFKYTGTDKS